MYQSRVIAGFFVAFALSVGNGLPVDVAAQTFLTQDQALTLVFPPECKAEHDPRTLSAQHHDLLRAQSADRDDMEKAHFFICRNQAGEPRHFALIDSEIGKHLPMTYIVGITPTGAVSRVELMVFRETYGSQVRQRSFMQQFTDARGADTLQVGETIQHVTGATLSSRGIARGVRRALLLWKHFYG